MIVVTGARPLVARLLSPLVWRTAGRASRKLMSFARAEEASRLDMLAAARLTPSPERRALYLRHALDEGRHATAFARRAAELAAEAGLPGPGGPAADIEDLYERLGEVAFLAFVHRGERRGRRQFEAYRGYFLAGRGVSAAGGDRMAALFGGILVDERRHEAYTRRLLVAVAGGARPARRALSMAALWEAARAWRRTGRALAQLIYVAAMTALYVAALPLALLVRLGGGRAGAAGWREPPATGRPR